MAWGNYCTKWTLSRAGCPLHLGWKEGEGQGKPGDRAFRDGRCVFLGTMSTGRVAPI